MIQIYCFNHHTDIFSISLSPTSIAARSIFAVGTWSNQLFFSMGDNSKILFPAWSSSYPDNSKKNNLHGTGDPWGVLTHFGVKNGNFRPFIIKINVFLV